MCFSAGASFTVSAILMAGSVTALKKVQSPSQVPFALIPLIFSVQQFTEGIVWLSLTNSSYAGWQGISTYIFLAFAQIVWPVWVPLSFWLIEKDPQRKKMLAVILGLGAVISAYLAYCIVSYKVSSGISSHHIRYDLDYPHYYLPFSGVFYFIPTIMPPILSSVKKTSMMGLIVFASFLVSKLFFSEYVISVWCFFAAAISIVVVLIMAAFKTEAEHNRKPWQANKIV